MDAYKCLQYLFRNAEGNTGNVEENKSLYWNPVIYKVLNPEGATTFEIVDVWHASAYYIFRTGEVRAFPSGLKMRANGDSDRLSRVEALCDGESPCQRQDNGGCEGYAPSNQADHAFLPIDRCSG